MVGLGGQQTNPGLLGTLTIAEVVSLLPYAKSNKNLKITDIEVLLSQIPHFVWNLPASQFIPLHFQRDILKGFAWLTVTPNEVPATQKKAQASVSSSAKDKLIQNN